MKKYKLQKFKDINTYDYSWFAREMTEEELYIVNGGSTVEDTHTVQSGDTLGTLVYNYNQANGTNLTVSEVAESNGIEDPNLIYVGQTINFGNSGEEEITNAAAQTDTPTDNSAADTTPQQQNQSTETNSGTKPASDYSNSSNCGNTVNYETTYSTSPDCYNSESTDPDERYNGQDYNGEHLMVVNYKDKEKFGEISGYYLTIGKYGSADTTVYDGIGITDDTGKIVLVLKEEQPILIYSNHLGLSVNEKKVSSKLLKNEKNVETFVRDIEKNPDNYYIEIFQRRAMGKGKKTELMTHTLYLVTNKVTGEKSTLSFNGSLMWFYSQGAWGLNTSKDLKGLDSYINGNNDYDMSLYTSGDKIDVQQTAANIINSIYSDTTYYFKDHLEDKYNMENCNTGVFETEVLKQ